jgi:hypothetical protein
LVEVEVVLPLRLLEVTVLLEVEVAGAPTLEEAAVAV